MDANELESKWSGLRPDAQGTFKSLRITGDCIPDLYIGIDLNNTRCLILKLPERHSTNFVTVVKQNLSLEFFGETNWVLLKLSNALYKDLFNDLILSLYDKVKALIDVNQYTTILIDVFYRWSEFFEDGSANILSEEIIMGLVGEMHYLVWEIENGAPLEINEILLSWHGPFDRGNDFVFNNRNVEVKTKQIDALDVMISSEFQMQPEIGKGLHLIVVDLVKEQEGISLSDLTNKVRSLIVSRMGDFSILLKAFRQKGLTMLNISNYDHIKFTFVSMLGYDCIRESFPKINVDTKPRLVNNVKYNIRISELGSFIIKRYN